MVKKKVKRASKKKTKVVRGKTAKKKVTKKRPVRGAKVWRASLFVRILLIAVFVYGVFKMWNDSWSDGLKIIAAVLLIWFLIKLIAKIIARKK